MLCSGWFLRWPIFLAVRTEILTQWNALSLHELVDSDVTNAAS